MYAACGTDNAVSSVNGMSSLVSDGTYMIQSETQGVGTQYDCCVSCLTNPFCGVAQYYTNNGGGCNLYSNQGTCDPSVVYGGIVAIPGGGYNSFFSNSNCGRFTYEGIPGVST